MVITVTGSTGHIGSELVRLLSAAGAPTRAVLRNVNRIRPTSHVAWIQADLTDPDVLEPTLAGTASLFLLSDNAPGFGELQIAILQAAQREGVRHVVKLSALGASDHSKSTIAREHWTVEQALQQMDLSWTILRPHSFMQNWLDDVAASVRAEGVIYSPIGDAVVPFIDTRDIAAVAAEALLHPEAHAGRRYFLTGGEAVGFADIARALSEVTGKTVSYWPITIEAVRAQLEAKGTPAELVEAMLAILTYQRAGGPTATVSDKAEQILGRPPRSVADFVRDHAKWFA